MSSVSRFSVFSSAQDAYVSILNADPAEELLNKDKAARDEHAEFNQENMAYAGQNIASRELNSGYTYSLEEYRHMRTAKNKAKVSTSYKKNSEALLISCIADESFYNEGKKIDLSAECPTAVARLLTQSFIKIIPMPELNECLLEEKILLVVSRLKAKNWHAIQPFPLTKELLSEYAYGKSPERRGRKIYFLYDEQSSWALYNLSTECDLPKELETRSWNTLANLIKAKYPEYIGCDLSNHLFRMQKNIISDPVTAHWLPTKPMTAEQQTRAMEILVDVLRNMSVSKGDKVPQLCHKRVKYSIEQNSYPELSNAKNSSRKKRRTINNNNALPDA